jgi:GGDEF domain-containing protein
LRISGDEFILIFPDVIDMATLDMMAVRLIREVENPSLVVVIAVRFRDRSGLLWPVITQLPLPENYLQMWMLHFTPSKGMAARSISFSLSSGPNLPSLLCAGP